MTRKHKLGLPFLCLLLCSACSGKERVVTVPTVERVPPPESLLRETPRPKWSGATNGDLLDYVFEVGSTLDRCNADKAALRDWVARVATNGNSTEQER